MEGPTWCKIELQNKNTSTFQNSLKSNLKVGQRVHLQLQSDFIVWKKTLFYSLTFGHSFFRFPKTGLDTRKIDIKLTFSYHIKKYCKIGILFKETKMQRKVKSRQYASSLLRWFFWLLMWSNIPARSFFFKGSRISVF